MWAWQASSGNRRTLMTRLTGDGGAGRRDDASGLDPPRRRRGVLEVARPWPRCQAPHALGCASVCACVYVDRDIIGPEIIGALPAATLRMIVRDALEFRACPSGVHASGRNNRRLLRGDPSDTSDGTRRDGPHLGYCGVDRSGYGTKAQGASCWAVLGN